MKKFNKKVLLSFFAVVFFRPPPPPAPFSKLDPATHRKTEQERQVADGIGGKGVRGVREEPNPTTARKPGPL